MRLLCILSLLFCVLGAGCATRAPRTIVVVHPSGFAGSERIHDWMNSELHNSDRVIWLYSGADDPWPYRIPYDERRAAPGGQCDLGDLRGAVWLAGGYFKACYAQACRKLPSDARIIIPIHGVYYGSTRTLAEQIQANGYQPPPVDGAVYWP